MMRLGRCARASRSLFANGRVSAGAAQIRLYSAAPSYDPNEGFVRGLFGGKIRETQVFPYPDALIDDERESLEMMAGPIMRFFEEKNDATKNDENEKVPDDVLQGMKDLGLFGLQIPEEFGGAGLSNTGYARMVEAAGATTDLGIGITLGAHNSIGLKGIILEGTEEQKEKYLPSLATGETIAAFALTEPSSGSDANSIRTRAKLSEDGKTYILNGNKIWISGGGLAEIFTLFAQTEVKCPKTGEMKDKVTAFIVERSFGGLTHGPPEKKMGIKASNTVEIILDNVPVPAANVLGEVGGGFKVAMSILNAGRFGMSSALAGVSKTLMKLACEHATTRVQFGSTISSYGLVKEKFANMAMRTYVAESIGYLIAANMDRGSHDYHLEAAVGKVFASQAAWDTCDDCIQIMGGNGFMRSYPFERVLRDLRIFRIFEGANDILTLFIALTGIQSAGKDLKELQKALKSPFSNTELLGQELPKRVLGMIGKGGDSLSGAHPELNDCTKLIEARTAQFGKAVETLLIKHGKNIIHEQLKLKRIAQSAIDIYAMAAVTSRATKALNDKVSSAQIETVMARAWCEDADSRVRFHMKKLNPSEKTTDSKVEQIADAVFEHGGYVPVHPLRSLTI